MKLLKSSKGRAAAIAAALFLIFGVVLAAGRLYGFHNPFSDGSGLVLVRKGNTKDIKRDSERKNTLYVAVTDALGLTNPAYATGEEDQMISSLIFEGLMRQDDKGVYEKQLVKDFTMQPDGTSCEITIKPDVKFSDGTVMTAQDVAFSIAAMCVTAGESAGGPWGNIEGLEEFLQGAVDLPSGIQVESDTKLTVRFSDPSPDNMLLALCQIQKKPDDMSGAMVSFLPSLSSGGIGTGAYQKAESSISGSIRLEASSEYRKKVRDIKAVEFVRYGTHNITEALENGSVDMAFYTGNSGMYEPFYEKKQFSLYEVSLDSVYYLAVNRDSELLRQDSARKAVALSIDRKALAEGSLSRYMSAAGTMAWENSSLSGADPLSCDRSKAQKLLAEAKSAIGASEADIKLPVLVGNQIQEAIADQVKEDLAHTGFTVQVEELEQSDYLQQVYMTGDYDLLISGAGGWQTPSAYDRYTEDASGIRTSTASEAVRAAVGAVQTAYDKKALETAIKNANTTINRMAPVIPLARQKKYLAISADISGWKMNRYDHFINNVWEMQMK